MKKNTSKNTNRALRDTNANKTTVLLSHLKNNYAFIVQGDTKNGHHLNLNNFWNY